MTNTATENRFLQALKNTNRRIYISGPMTGIHELNAPLFRLAENIIKDMGFDPINPHKVVDIEALKACKTPADEWALCMKQDIKALMDCGGAIMLPNWNKSTGATWEFLNCKTLKIPVFTPFNPKFFEEHPLHNPVFELLNLTEPEYMELFFNITKKIKENESLILTE